MLGLSVTKPSAFKSTFTVWMVNCVSECKTLSDSVLRQYMACVVHLLGLGIVYGVHYCTYYMYVYKLLLVSFCARPIIRFSIAVPRFMCVDLMSYIHMNRTLLCWSIKVHYLPTNYVKSTSCISVQSVVCRCSLY
jgi:hypothetical protein